MPIINCKADNYAYVKEGDTILVFNNIFESRTYLILLSSLLELFIPDTRAFNVPIAIEIRDDKNSTVTIDKNLKISGSECYRYFILKRHYKKWRKTYFVSNCILIGVAFILTSAFLYGFIFTSGLNILMGIAFLAIALLNVFLIVKLVKQFKLVKKYGIEDRHIMRNEEKAN